MAPTLKQWLPLREPEPMTAFDPEAWPRPRPPWTYKGDSMQEKMSRMRDQLIRELELATDDQLRELGKNLDFMGRVQAELVLGMAKRRGLV